MINETVIPQSSFPRERLVEYGVDALSNQELLAILLRTGSRPLNVLELAASVLNRFQELYELKQATIDELQEIRGVGQIKAIEIKAMVELGVRIQRSAQPKYGKVTSSMAIAHQLIQELKDCRQEHLLGLYLNTKNEIIQKSVDRSPTGDFSLGGTLQCRPSDRRPQPSQRQSPSLRGRSAVYTPLDQVRRLDGDRHIGSFDHWRQCLCQFARRGAVATGRRVKISRVCEHY